MILIYSENINPRLQWVCSVIFGDMLLKEAKLTTDKSLFINSDLPKINYSNDQIEGVAQIEPHALLFEKGIRIQKISFKEAQVPLFFTNDDSFLGFDPLAAAFYLLSRYEEYLPHEKDNHGRYKFTNCLAFKHNFIEIPIVDYWAMMIRDRLITNYPKIEFNQRAFTCLPTMDVDVAYAYKGRTFLRNSRSILKDVATLKFSRIKDRMSIRSGADDPFDTYSYFEKLITSYGLKKRFFFLLGDYGTYDKNLNHDHPDLINLISKYTDEAGSHPSYAVHANEAQLSIEKKRLEDITQIPVFRNRYHYLKFTLPESFQKLEELGFREDYSMAYPEMPGFRTGTCTPYQFYDLQKESPSHLKIFTTAVMDATCQDYLKLDPAQALERIKKLIDEVRSVNGTFIPLWHNDTLSEQGKWKGWKDVLKDCLEYAKSI